MGYRYKKNNNYADLPDISDIENYTGGKGIRGCGFKKPQRENYTTFGNGASYGSKKDNYTTYGHGDSYGSKKENYTASTHGRGGLPIPVGSYNVETPNIKTQARQYQQNRYNQSHPPGHPPGHPPNRFNQPINRHDPRQSQNYQAENRHEQSRPRARIHTRENYKCDIKCIDICDHIKGCPICSKFYKTDKTIYVIVIVLLCLINLILLKKVLKV